MIKKLRLYTLSSFLKPFSITFFVTLFFFVLQFIWVWVDELVGKGLDLWIVLKLLMYLTATLVPKALPIAILLSSIMTLGTFGEKNELAAVKASGISLVKFLRPLMVFTLFLSIGVFFFSNYVIPQSQLKFKNILRNIYHKKPSISINADTFNELGNFVLFAGDKEGDSLKSVLIQERDENNDFIISSIRAKTGLINSSSDQNFIVMDLYNGVRTEKVEQKSAREQKIKQPFTATQFSHYKIHMNISGLNDEDLEAEKVKNVYSMLNVFQLSEEITKLEDKRNRSIVSLGEEVFGASENLGQFVKREKFQRIVKPDSMAVIAEKTRVSKLQKEVKIIPLVDSLLTPQEKLKLLSLVSDKLKQKIQSSTRYKERVKYQQQHLNDYIMAFHDKFTFSSILIVFLLTGASLGAIIRKGGLGVPIIVGILVYMLYYVMYIIFKRFGEETEIDPILAMWYPVIILSPISIWMLYKSNKDSALFKAEFYFKIIKPILPLIQKLIPKKKKKKSADA